MLAIFSTTRKVVSKYFPLLNYLEMSDSENESNSGSLQHDLMSVSDQEGDGSRDEDDMPSAEIDLSEGHEQAKSGQEEDSVATNSTSSEDLAQLPAVEELLCAKKLLETKKIKDLDDTAVRFFYKS